MNKHISYKISLVLLLMTNISLGAMDWPQLQLERSNRKPIFCEKLLIDHKVDRSRTYLAKSRVEYHNKKDRKTYPLTETLEIMPLATPFIKVIFINNETGKKIRTIFPVTRLMNYSNGSVIHFDTADCTFHLTCTKNDKLITKQKYFPQNKQGNTFETQFLSCMNHFYRKIKCISDNPNEKDLIENNILQIARKDFISIQLGGVQTLTGLIGNLTIILPQTIYSHGSHGCSSPEHLVKLATNSKIKNSGYSVFNHIMKRQQTNKHLPKPKQANPEASGSLKCYYNYLENVKNVGNKSPMPQTIHAYKSPAVNIDHIKPIKAEETLESLEFLNNILEDCWVEFDIQEKTETAALESIIENCLTDYAAQEIKNSARNNLEQTSIKTTEYINTALLLMVQRSGEYSRHEHCVLL